MAYVISDKCIPLKPPPPGMVFIPSDELSKLKGSALLVLSAYCYYAQRKFRSPSMTETASLVKRSKDAIIEAQRRLCKYGYLEKIPTQVLAKQPIPDEIRWQVWERDNFTCKHCGTRQFLTIDHIQPESKGGTLALENLQTLCKSCNSRKGAV